MFGEVMHRFTEWAERVIVVLLGIMAVLAIIEVGFELVRAVTDETFLSPAATLSVLDAVLVVFIILELMSIAFAYIERRPVISTVLEAGLVAVVRKLVVFEAEGEPLYVFYKAAGVAVLILALGITWYLLRRARVHGTESPADDRTTSVPEGSL